MASDIIKCSNNQIYAKLLIQSRDKVRKWGGDEVYKMISLWKALRSLLGEGKRKEMLAIGYRDYSAKIWQKEKEQFKFDFLMAFLLKRMMFLRMKG